MLYSPPLQQLTQKHHMLCTLLPLTPHTPQEQRIRASHNIKQLSARLKEQRLKVADRITKRMGAPVRILTPEMEQNTKVGGGGGRGGVGAGTLLVSFCGGVLLVPVGVAARFFPSNLYSCEPCCPTAPRNPHPPPPGPCTHPGDCRCDPPQWRGAGAECGDGGGEGEGQLWGWLGGEGAEHILWPLPPPALPPILHSSGEGPPPL